LTGDTSEADKWIAVVADAGAEKSRMTELVDKGIERMAERGEESQTEQDQDRARAGRKKGEKVAVDFGDSSGFVNVDRDGHGGSSAARRETTPGRLRKVRKRTGRDDSRDDRKDWFVADVEFGVVVEYTSWGRHGYQGWWQECTEKGEFCRALAVRCLFAWNGENAEERKKAERVSVYQLEPFGWL
jgi:hypothetical protein